MDNVLAMVVSIVQLLENQHLHNQHIQDQASQAELLKELLRTQKQLEGANADLSSLEVNIETQDSQGPRGVPAARGT